MIVYNKYINRQFQQGRSLKEEIEDSLDSTLSEDQIRILEKQISNHRDFISNLVQLLIDNKVLTENQVLALLPNFEK